MTRWPRSVPSETPAKAVRPSASFALPPATRASAAEHQLYPAALALVAGGKAKLADGRTVFAGVSDGTDRGQRVIAPSIHHDETPDLESLARFTP